MRNTKILYLQFGVVATSPTSLLEPSLTEDPEDGSGMGSPVLTKYIMRPLDAWKFIDDKVQRIKLFIGFQDNWKILSMCNSYL